MNHSIIINPAAGENEKIRKFNEPQRDQPYTEDFIDKLFEQDLDRSEFEYKRPESVKEMTMAEYKQYIYAQIQQMPVNPSNRQDMVSIRISEAGFAAMKEDPEYEKWVLHSIMACRMRYDPLGNCCGGKYVTLSFGASREGYREECWRPPCVEDERRQQELVDRENQRKAERKRRLKEQYKKLLEKRALEKHIFEKKLQQKRLTEAWAARRREYSRFLQAWSIERYK